MTETEIARSMDEEIVRLREQVAELEGLKTKLERLEGARAALNGDPQIISHEPVVEAVEKKTSRRARKSSPTKQPYTKVTDDVARQIRADEGSLREIGERFKVSRTTVRNIKLGRGKWASL